MKKVIIDTDPGIDDAAAIFLALASPELSVEAITTVYGNGSIDACTHNACRILYAAGRLDIPVFKGAAKPLLRLPNQGWAAHVHGADALGNTRFPLPPAAQSLLGERHAALEIISRVMKSPGQVTLLALGRLTNLALALSLEPRLAQAVAEIVVMGGAVYVPGNVSPVASANLYEDPEAAAIVYSSGAPLVQVGLDVCNRVTLSRAQLDQVQATGTATTRLLAEATGCLRAYYLSQGMISEADGVRYNDVPAVAYAVEPGLFGTSDFHVEIETRRPLTRGQTVAYRLGPAGQPPNAKVCLEVDSARLTRTFTERVSSYRPPALTANG